MSSDLAAYDVDKYAMLQGYVDDMLQICNELDLSNVSSSDTRSAP